MTTPLASRRPRTVSRARRAVAASVVVVLALGLAACSGRSEDPLSPVGVPAVDEAAPEPSETAATAELRDPTPGVVEVDGQIGTLTTRARTSFSRADTGVTVRAEGRGEDRGFARLCLGDVDVVDSARAISPEELEACRRNGLDVLQLQVAADAVVLAIRDETDVGDDCLSTDQVQTSFRTGSTVERWSQLGDGFDDLAFAAGGPALDVGAARVLTGSLRDSDDPVSADLRSDYQAASTEDRTLRFVTGTGEERRGAPDLASVQPDWVEQRARLRRSYAAYRKAQQEVRTSLAQQRRAVLVKRSAAVRAQRDRRVARAYTRRDRVLAELRADQARFTPLDGTYRDLLARRRSIADSLGHVGLFSHGYYATHEDRLRPFAVGASDGDDQPDCVLPSPQTILDGRYPLSHPVLLTVTTRSLQRPDVAAFLTGYLRSGRRYAAAEGLVALPAPDVRRQLAWLADGATLPRFDVVDGEVREVTDQDAPTTESPLPPVQRPAQ